MAIQAHFSPLRMIPYIWHCEEGCVGDIGPVGRNRSRRAASISAQEGQQHAAQRSQQSGTTQHGQ